MKKVNLDLEKDHLKALNYIARKQPDFDQDSLFEELCNGILKIRIEEPVLNIEGTIDFYLDKSLYEKASKHAKTLGFKLDEVLRLMLVVKANQVKEKLEKKKKK